jgi:hypothetical protein
MASNESMLGTMVMMEPKAKKNYKTKKKKEKEVVF